MDQEETKDTKCCLNCGTPVEDAFCPHCGQKTSVHRLDVSTAIVENTWSAFRMDRGVIPTAWLLATRPWVVIRNYIHGHRVAYTQPVRFIVIMCFVNILLQMFLPDSATEAAEQTAAAATHAEGFWLHLWHAVQAFVRDSEVLRNIIESVIFAPVIYLIFLPWGSRRFNLAEYSTALLYIFGAVQFVEFLMSPLGYISPLLEGLVVTLWSLYLLYGTMKRAFPIRRRVTRVCVMLCTMLLITAVGVLTSFLLYY